MVHEQSELKPDIKRLLIANRGEIACRIMVTARLLGIETVAIYSDPDADALHVREADTAVAIGGSASSESYLDPAKVIAAAQAAGADAIHPGYGFLSENADFADVVIKSGLIWVGPSPDSIRAMAGKVGAKQIAADAGVPLVPGAEIGAETQPEQLITIADSVGYPLLVKASAGGGGKGMRIVSDSAGVINAVETAQREALNSFADGTVFFERYLAGARHVEVQVFGDNAGNVVHLFDRECSIQRRHQKIIEEAPSPGTTDSVRERMFAAATSLARQINYVGAGTVEFLVFGQGDQQEFFFLEMNTRLQVEHPVTESITGTDLVEWQLRVAAGQDLPFTQDEIHCHGHSIEARIYAEDPALDYLPSTGTVAIADWYGGLVPLRVDTGVTAGDVISPYYDPMLAKVISANPSRAEAISELTAWLRQFRIAGIVTNRDALIAILESADFQLAQTPTNFLDNHPELFVTDVNSRNQLDEFAVVAAVVQLTRDAAPATVPWASVAYPGFRNVRACPQLIQLRLPGREVAVAVEFDSAKAGRAEVSPGSDEARWTRRVDGVDFQIHEMNPDMNQFSVSISGIRKCYSVETSGAFVSVSDGREAVACELIPRFMSVDVAAATGSSQAPMPGTVVAVSVNPGDHVAQGELLVVMEAMKMEHRIVADTDGIVAQVSVAAGDAVDAHQVLVVVESEG